MYLSYLSNLYKMSCANFIDANSDDVFNDVVFKAKVTVLCQKVEANSSRTDRGKIVRSILSCRVLFCQNDRWSSWSCSTPEICGS